MPTNFAKMESAFVDVTDEETEYAYATVQKGVPASPPVLVGYADDVEGERQFVAPPSGGSLQADVNGMYTVQLLIRPEDGEDALPDKLSVYTWVRTQIVEDGVTSDLWAPLEAEPTTLFEGAAWLDDQCFVSPVIELSGGWDRLAVEVAECSGPVRIYATPARVVGA